MSDTKASVLIVLAMIMASGCSVFSSNDEPTLQAQIDDLKAQLSKVSSDASKALKSAKQSDIAAQQAADAAKEALKYAKDANSKLDDLLNIDSDKN